MRAMILVMGLMALEACGGSADGQGVATEEASTTAETSASSTSSSSTSTSSSTSSSSPADPVTSITCGGTVVDCLTGNWSDSVGLSGTGGYLTWVVGASRYWCEGAAVAPCPKGTPCTLYERSADGGPTSTVGTFACGE